MCFCETLLTDLAALTTGPELACVIHERERREDGVMLVRMTRGLRKKQTGKMID